MSNLVDTLLNIWAFVFVGLLIWLYLKPTGNQRLAEGPRPAEPGHQSPNGQSR